MNNTCLDSFISDLTKIKTISECSNIRELRQHEDLSWLDHGSYPLQFHQVLSSVLGVKITLLLDRMKQEKRFQMIDPQGEYYIPFTDFSDVDKYMDLKRGAKQ